MVVDLNQLSKRDLLALIELKQALGAQKQEDALMRLLEAAILLEGKKGRGKTLTAVGIGYQLRELFGRHLISVGSKMGLKPEFGEFGSMDEKEFRNELERITDVVTEEEGAEAVAEAFSRHGLSVLYSTMVFDEAYKLFDCRTPSDKLVRLFGYFIAQMRHYFCTVLLLTPSREMIDKRVRQQLDWQGRCFHNDYTHKCTVRLIGGLETLTFVLDGADGALHVPYYEMYNSWNLVGYRRKHLDIKKL